MNQPSKLQRGDMVAIIAPAKKVTKEEIAPALKILKQWGLNIIEGKNLYSEDHYFAGTDHQRLSDLQKMLDHHEVKAIFCARGGYGTTRLLDQVNWNQFKLFPKWLVGFSDITTLHTHLITQDTASIHGPMAFNFGKPDATPALQHLRKLLFGEATVMDLPDHSLNKSYAASGLIIGGNLSMLTNIIGTSSDINYNQRILMLEEVEEYYYRIDRMMIHLLRSGKLDHLSALVVGQFSNMMENQIPFGKDAYQIISDVVAPFDYPVYFNASFGHINNNYAFPHGIPGTIENVGKDWQLKWEIN